MKSGAKKQVAQKNQTQSSFNWKYFTLNSPVVSTEVSEKYAVFNEKGITEALGSDADFFVIAESAKDFKFPQIPTLQTGKAQSWIVSDFKRTHFIRRTMLGWDDAKENAHVIILNKKSLELLFSQDFQASNTSDLIYLTQKALIPMELICGNLDLKKRPSFLHAKSLSIQRSFQYFMGKHRSISKITFAVLFIIGFLFITRVSQHAGISGDEFVQHQYGKLIASFHLKKIGVNVPIDTLDLKGQKMNTIAASYEEMGANIAKLEDPDRLMHLYGSSFDTFCAVLIHFFNIEDFMEFRHFWNSLFGFLIFVYGALIVRRLTQGSWLWASVAFIILFVTPRIFGEALNNPKDIPFALGYIMSLYYAIKVFHSYPYFRAWDVIGLVFGIALGISIRIGGLLTIAIIGVYMGLKFIHDIGWKSFMSFKWKNLKNWLLFFVGISITAYIAGIYVWPYGWQAPIDNPLKALQAFTDYQVSLRQLFEGVLYDSDKLPPHYLVKYIWITMPIGVILGFFAYLILSLIKRSSYTNEEFLLLFSAVFPIFYIFIQGSSVYGGLRHILFTLPGFIILAVYGYFKLSHLLPKPKITGVSLALIPAILPLRFIVQNQNLSYIYFNETIGGIDGAYGNYELDYYLASLKPSADYLIDNVIKPNPSQKLNIVSYGMDQVTYYLRKYPNVKVGFTRFDDRSDKPWDYAVFYNAYMDKHRLQNNYYPPLGTVFAPKIDGKAVGCVVKRISDKDLQGILALNQENNPEKALDLFRQYLALDSTSSEIWFYLASVHANLGNTDSALFYAHKSSHVFKENSRAQFLKYQLFLQGNNYQSAINTMEQYIQSRPKDPDGYIMKGQAQMLKKDFYGAIESVQKALPMNPFDERIFKIGAQAYQNLKDNSNMQLWYSAAILKQATTAQEQNTAIQSIQRIYAEATGEELDLNKYFK